MFNSTEDAIKQGLEADYFDRARWYSLREMFKAQCKRALYRRQFDLASMFATQAQFCREALQAEKITSNLEALQGQFKPDGNNCAICGDNDHQAFECHYKPI